MIFFLLSEAKQKSSLVFVTWVSRRSHSLQIISQSFGGGYITRQN